MAGEATRDQFDRAYGHLKNGEIEKAATCFQHIIDNPDKYDPMAQVFAKQRLIWYCIPLELIITDLKKSKNPVNIIPLLTELLESKDEYNTIEFSQFIKTIESELDKIPFCVHIGPSTWIHIDHLQIQIIKLIDTINKNGKPIKLEDFFNEVWKDYCEQNPGFLNLNARTTISELINNKSVRVVASSIILPNDFLMRFFNTYKDNISQKRQPTSLSTYLMEFLNLPITEMDYLSISDYLILNLDQDLLCYSKDLYLTKSIINFDNVDFGHDGLFNDNRNLWSTVELLKNVITLVDDTTPSEEFISFVEEILKKYKKLIEHQEGLWFSQVILTHHYSEILRVLEKEENIFTIETLITKGIGWGKEINFFDQYKEIILKKILEAKLLIQVTNQQWMFKIKVIDFIQQIYDYLLQVGPKNSKEIIRNITDNLTNETILGSFSKIIEERLRQDPRFEIHNEKGEVWKAIKPWKKNHDLILEYFKRNHAPFTFSKILTIPGVDAHNIEIENDERFKLFPNDQWGLSSWVWINDLVYEYLNKTKQNLHIIFLVHKISEDNRLNQEDTIFLPEQDPRFSQDSLNRWFCKHLITEEEIVKLLTELDKYGGIGRRLNQLTNNILHLDSSSTNADEILDKDPRFLIIDDIWYSKKSAYNFLIQNDIDELFLRLSELPNETNPISIKEMGKNYLGIDGRLSNLADLLQNDERFIEYENDFWALTSWNEPDFSRKGFEGNIPVRRKQGNEEGGSKTSELPGELTKRTKDGKQGSESKDENKKIYLVLGQLDIIHGNIRITEQLRPWIPDDALTIRINCKDGFESIGIINKEKTILGIKELIQSERLTYGDKIQIRPGIEDGTLRIDHYGRDEKIYQEAIKHKDIEKIILEAKLIDKSYHDLMIGVMQAMGIPLKKEDIFQLVDYQRTASRNTISEILSLPECPYEELRYFVKQGNGFWIFDNSRKVAFDMKMKELEEENNSLKEQLLNLIDKARVASEIDKEIEEDSTKIKKLETMNKELQDEIKEMKNKTNQIITEKEVLTINSNISEIEFSRLEKEKANTELALKQSKEIIESLQNEVISLRNAAVIKNNEEIKKAELINEMERLKGRIAGLEEENKRKIKENHDLQDEVNLRKSVGGKHYDELMISLEKEKEQADTIERLSKEIEKINNQLLGDQKRTDDDKNKIENVIKIETNKNKELINELETTSETIKRLERDNSNQKDEIMNYLSRENEMHRDMEVMKAKFAKIDKALSSPLGRLFARIKKLS